MVYLSENSAFAAAEKFVMNFNFGKNASKDSKTKMDYARGGGLSNSSIMKAAKGLTMSFPVICSNTLQPSTAAMITKAIERNCVTTLQLLFSATYLRGSSGQDVLRKFHKNIDDDISMDDYLDIADSLGNVLDSTKLGKSLTGKTVKYVNGVNNFMNGYGESCTEEEFTKKALAEIASPSYYDEDFSERSISGYYLEEQYAGGEKVVYEASGKDIRRMDSSTRRRVADIYDNIAGSQAGGYIYNSNDGLFYPNGSLFDGSTVGGIDPKDMIADPLYHGKGARYITINQFKANMDAMGYAKDAQRDMINRGKILFDQHAKNRELEQKSKEYQLNVDKFEYQKSRDAKSDTYQDLQNARRAQEDQLEFMNKQLLDNDVKKCNELIPSLIVIRYNQLGASDYNGVLVEDQFIAGVKATLYPENSRTIIDKVSDVFSKNSGKLGWLKATTGEISFMKDFILGIEKAKISSKQDNYQKVSPIWSHLKWRSSKSVLNRLRKNKPNDAGAITTLVISSEEADYLKKEMEIDLTDVKTAQKVMEAYNFMCIVIVDENFEVARFLFDGASYYQDIAFSSLEREANDSSYKKVVNLISKINRG